MHRWIFNEGDYTLTGGEFLDIVSSGQLRSPVYNGKATIDLYNNPTYDFAIGRATVTLAYGVVVGFYDRFDFDPKKWGVRSTKAELATRAGAAIGAITNATPFTIKY